MRSRWEGLTRFLNDGRIEIDSNIVERSTRMRFLPDPTAVPRTGPSSPSLVEIFKLNAVNSLAYLTDALTRIVNDYPNSRIDDLLPWAYIAEPDLKAVAENSGYGSPSVFAFRSSEFRRPTA